VNEPISQRKGQWIVFIEIRASKANKGKTNDSPVSTAYSSVIWSNVKSLFNSIDYVQTQLEINDEHLNFRARYLSLATKCLGTNYGMEAKRLHFIAPVLICVSSLFEGEFG
jgi:hypothetical protein